MSPNDAEGMANSVDCDQTAPPGSALFAQAYLSKNLGSSRSSLIWVCTACPGISVQKLRIIRYTLMFQYQAKKIVLQVQSIRNDMTRI